MAESAESVESVEIKNLVLSIIRAIVDQPDKVELSVIEGQQSVVLELSVDPADVGKVIGRQGIHADALRRIIHAVGGKHKRRYLLEILQDGKRF